MAIGQQLLLFLSRVSVTFSRQNDMFIAKFPFTRIGKTNLGDIFRPYATVSIYSSKRNQWIEIDMLVDTGADYTMLPKRYARLLKIDLKSECMPITTLGIGGVETVYLPKQKMKIKIGQWEKRIPLGILDRDNIPALLGRLECSETIKLVFDKHITYLEK